MENMTKTTEKSNNKGSLLALSPILVFLGSGIITGDFYKMPALAALISLVMISVISSGYGTTSAEAGSFEIIKVVPYVAVLVGALAGANVFVLLGGVIGLIKHNGGIEFILNFITSKIKTATGAKFGIALLASMLDIFASCWQGMIPYGAQILTAVGIAGVSSVAIIKYLHYPIFLLIFGIISITIDFSFLKKKKKVN